MKIHKCDVCEGEHAPVYHTYKMIKRSCPNEIILLRVGDFYESFGDVELISRLCNLLARPVGKRQIVGFPYKSLEQYAHTLNLNGYVVRVFEPREKTQ